jgi:hypothetical protein
MYMKFVAFLANEDDVVMYIVEVKLKVKVAMYVATSNRHYVNTSRVIRVFEKSHKMKQKPIFCRYKFKTFY